MTFPLNDTWLLIEFAGTPMTVRLSQVQSAEKAPSGNVLVSVTTEEVPLAKFELDMTWAKWLKLLGCTSRLMTAS